MNNADETIRLLDFLIKLHMGILEQKYAKSGKVISSEELFEMAKKNNSVLRAAFNFRFLPINQIILPSKSQQTHLVSKFFPLNVALEKFDFPKHPVISWLYINFFISYSYNSFCNFRQTLLLYLKAVRF